MSNNRALSLLIAFSLAMSLVGVSPLRSQDGDGDQIPDSLELALAQRFFPTLNLHCESYDGYPKGDRRQLYGHDVPGYSNSSNGKLPFTARPFYSDLGFQCIEPFQCIEIRFGIAWNWDLGDNYGGDAHNGDSETYAVLLTRKPFAGNSSPWGATWAVAQNDAFQWRLVKEFFSAHWTEPLKLGRRVDSSSFRSHGISGVVGPQRVWCAEGKHAMYPTQSACNDGGWMWADDCSDNRCDLRADIYLDVQNVGEASAPLNSYIPSPSPVRTYPPFGTYDVWGGLGFGDASPYRGHFLRPLDWCPTYQQCESTCGYPYAECPEGYFPVGGCNQDCGWGSEQGGLLCQTRFCF
jgi:hypothetical protein